MTRATPRSREENDATRAVVIESEADARVLANAFQNIDTSRAEPSERRGKAARPNVVAKDGGLASEGRRCSWRSPWIASETHSGKKNSFARVRAGGNKR